MTICGKTIRVRGQDLKCELPPGHSEPHFAPHDQRCPSASIFLEDCALGLGHEGRHSDGVHVWGYPPVPTAPVDAPVSTPDGTSSNTVEEGEQRYREAKARIAAACAVTELVDDVRNFPRCPHHLDDARCTRREHSGDHEIAEGDLVIVWPGAPADASEKVTQWPTVDEVPEGVKFVAVNGPYPVVYVNRDGVRYLVGDGLPSDDDAEFINQFAPFIAVEAAQ